MKATGIVRRIDDLGRVVIPKEIRRTMRIREGDPLEIFTDKDGGVIFKKYSLMGNQSEFVAQICEVLNKSTGLCTAVTDGDSVIACTGMLKHEVLEHHIAPDLESILHDRIVYKWGTGDDLKPVCEGAEVNISAAAPIVCGGDVLGCVLFVAPLDAPPTTETDCRLAQAMALFLARHMEM